ncbi:hypothetical protein [Nitrosomonas communis]|uniref:hypothetical protein n=1 Tax=Nitrosomonas communis TaxID=44574 RepID=UPI003D286075
MRFENEELEEFRIMPGDLLICEGAGQGAALSGMTNKRKFIFQKASHRARPLKGILAECLQICLATDSKLGRVDKYFTGVSIRRYLTGDKLSRYLLALPSTNEQTPCRRQSRPTHGLRQCAKKPNRGFFQQANCGT